jgi:hypothetical protein
MTTTPLIVRMALAADWRAAFRIVWDVSFEKATPGMGMPPGSIAIGMGNLPPWPERRRLCLSLARRCGEEDGDKELACAWTMLGADPRAPEWRTRAGDGSYATVFRALAVAIAADPTLVDDAAFAAAIEGWHVLEHAGSDGEDDLIVVARRYGAMAKIDRDEILAWAHRRTRRDDDVHDHIAASYGTAPSAASLGASARDSSRGHHAGQVRADARLREDTELSAVLGGFGAPLPRLPQADIARIADELLTIGRS